MNTIADLDSFSDVPRRLFAEIEKVIVGQRTSIELVVATLLSGGHVLLEDRPGVGKTALAKTLGRVLDIDTGRIQGTSDLLPSDVTGIDVFQPGDASWAFRPGPIFTQLLLVDELNRATPKAQAALLEAMEERQVTVDTSTHQLRSPFMVIATQNPLGEIGTHPLGAAQLDRFATLVQLGLPGIEAERAILSGTAGVGQLEAVETVVPATVVPELIDHVSTISATPELINFVLGCVEAVRKLDPSIWLSVRSAEVLLQTARGRAFVRGRDYVAPEDVQDVAAAVLRHRVPRGIEPIALDAAVRHVPAPVGTR